MAAEDEDEIGKAIVLYGEAVNLIKTQTPHASTDSRLVLEMYTALYSDKVAQLKMAKE